MMVLLSDEQSISIPFPVQSLAEAILGETLRQTGTKREAQISLRLIDDPAIRKLNASFRGIDAPTDVLSFPGLLFLEPGVVEEASLDAGCLDPDTGELLLGDIALSVERAARQAEEYGHGFRREVAFLIAHSILHLLGFDHETDEEAKQMEALQENILQTLEIPR